MIHNKIFTCAFDHAAEGMIITDPLGTICMVNPAFCNITGYTKEEVLGRNPSILQSGLITSDFYRQMWRSLQENGEWQGEIWNRKKSGEVYPEWLSIKGFKDESGNLVNYLGIFTEISTMEFTPEAIFIIGPSNEILYTNQAGLRLIGAKDKPEVIGKRYLEFVETAYRTVCEGHIQIALQKHKLHQIQEQILIRLDGKSIPVEGIIIPTIFSGTSAVQMIIQDISQQKETQKIINYMAYYDQLTKLPNWKSFEERLPQYVKLAVQTNTQLSIMYVNINQFTSINNTFGRSVGDLLLDEVTKRIKKCLRAQDLVFRTGGDEFVVLLPQLNSSHDAVEISNRLLGIFESPYIINNYKIFVTVSIGISTYPLDSTDAEELMKHADLALKQAKAQGKNTYQVYTSTLDIQAYKIFTMRNDLNKAIDQNELIVYYQPRVNPYTEKIVGAEALLRWNHTEWGMLFPDEFIPLAEESDLINTIGDWVLDKVCRQLKTWHEEGLPQVPISINVSGKQMMQADFFDKLSNLLDQIGLDGKWIEIEFTESTIVQNEAAVQNTIQKMNELGIKVAIDDFGAGYSSLIRLKKYPFNVIKIDRSFIKDIDINVGNLIITESVIRLAHGLGMSVVAEGVDSEKQLAILCERQCDEIQGYYYSKPVASLDFVKMLRKGLRTKNEKTDYSNRRKYFRVNLHYPLVSDMTIVSIQGRKVDVGSTEILVLDIGPGGLRFLSHIRLPVTSNIIIRFETYIFDHVQVEGYIVWSTEFQDSTYEYGIQFIITETELSSLTQIFNKFVIKLRKHPLVPECRLYTESKWNFFKEISEKEK